MAHGLPSHRIREFKLSKDKRTIGVPIKDHMRFRAAGVRCPPVGEERARPGAAQIDDMPVLPNRFSEGQIIEVLREHQAGIVSEVCRKHGISDATFYAWSAKSAAWKSPRPSG